MIGQSPVSGSDLQHLALGWRVGHLLGLEVCFLRSIQPVLRGAFLELHISPEPPLPRPNAFALRSVPNDSKLAWSPLATRLLSNSRPEPTGRR
jgi:hypothetical protein